MYSHAQLSNIDAKTLVRRLNAGFSCKKAKKYTIAIILTQCYNKFQTT
jgi:hypothetical protein